jgi:hypothetical protein
VIFLLSLWSFLPASLEWLLWFGWGSPKDSYVKAWSSEWCYWEVVETLRGGTGWEIFRSLGSALEGDNGTQPFPLPFSLASLRFWSTVFPPWCAASPQAQSNRANKSWTDPSKLWGTINLFSL